MAFPEKALFSWKECSKNVDISILSNFLAFFSNFSFSIEKFYQILSIYAKFQINWTIQTEITERRGGAGHTNLQTENQACLGLKL